MPARVWGQLLELRDAAFPRARPLTGLHASRTPQGLQARRCVGSTPLLGGGELPAVNETAVRRPATPRAAPPKHDSKLRLPANEDFEADISEQSDPRPRIRGIQNSGSRSKGARGPRRISPYDHDPRSPLLPTRAELLQTVKSLQMTTGPVQSHGLPLSPLMDPKLIEARERWRTVKPQAKPHEPDGRSPLHKAVEANPFARMLAQPVRTCPITEVRLPGEFMTPYIVVLDPKTGVPWQLPSNLHLNDSEKALWEEVEGRAPRSEEEPAEADSLTGNSAELTGELSAEAAGDEAAEGFAQSSEDEGDESTPDLEKFFSKNWVSTHYDVMKLFGSQQSPKQRKAYVSVRWLHSLAKSTLAKLQVRPDNADFILGLMRKKAMLSLALAARRGARHELVTPWPRPAEGDVAANLERVADRPATAQDMDDERQGVMVLWLGDASEDSSAPGQRGRAQEVRQHLTQAGRGAPLPVMEGPAGLVAPVLNLVELLGPEGVQWLKRSHPCFHGEAVAIKMRSRFRNAPVWLWRLHMFLDDSYRAAKANSGGVVNTVA